MKQMSLYRAIAICASGYFIDVFDIQLFAVLRVSSLKDLGVPATQLASIGGYILNAQMFGMILGAFLWGWLGDRHGRVKALYGSILIYSLGTFACGFVYDPLSYGFLRFITGFGLAGETGAAITLVAEMMPSAKRLWGIIIIAGIGYLGPVTAIIVSWSAPWRGSYMVAGTLGLIILALRVKLGESDLFTNIQQKNIVRGSLKILFQRPQIITALYCIMLGLPMTYCWFLLNFFSAEISRAVLLPDQVFKQSYALLAFYVGNAIGDVSGGILSQYLQSRRKAIATLYVSGAVVGIGHLLLGPQIGFTVAQFYGIYFLIGCSGGCWPLMNTLFTEHFGTNIRATATIVFINFVRALSIPMIFMFQQLQQTMSITNAAAIIGALFFTAGFFALRQLRETHASNLNYIEPLK
jgi:MFS family permease